MLNWDHWTVRALASSRKAERSEKDRKIWNDFSRKSVAEILGFSMQAKRACVSVNAAHHFCSVCVVFSCFFWPSSRKLPWPLTFWTKMGTPVTPAMGNFFTNCCFYMPLRFRVKIPCWTDRQTDGRTDRSTPVIPCHGPDRHFEFSSRCASRQHRLSPYDAADIASIKK